MSEKKLNYFLNRILKFFHVSNCIFRTLFSLPDPGLLPSRGLFIIIISETLRLPLASLFRLAELILLAIKHIYYGMEPQIKAFKYLVSSRELRVREPRVEGRKANSCAVKAIFAGLVLVHDR